MSIASFLAETAQRRDVEMAAVDASTGMTSPRLDYAQRAPAASNSFFLVGEEAGTLNEHGVESVTDGGGGGHFAPSGYVRAGALDADDSVLTMQRVS